VIASETARTAVRRRRFGFVFQSGHLLPELPADAVVLAGEQSGSLRYYTGRAILRWDAASPEVLEALAGIPGPISFDLLTRYADQLYVELAPKISLEAGERIHAERACCQRRRGVGHASISRD